MRATFDDIRQNQIEPNMKLLPASVYSYNGTSHQMTFYNGSTIQYGNWSGLESENKYQGQEYDVIIIDEATQFTERMFRHLAGCLRGNVGKGFPKKMLLTCNPGGVGHFWVKRLFIDRKFKVDTEHPEKSENPDDYAFVFAMAEDNTEALKDNPSYLEDISKMGNSDALRYGDWNVMSGQYFDNFDERIHVRKQFAIPEHWNRYRSFDYGLDMTAVFWEAVDEDGRTWVYRSFEQSNLNIQDAAAKIMEHTLRDEKISTTFAPPDLWSRQRETGRSAAEIMMTSGLDMIKADNNRIQGHLVMRSLLEPIPLYDEYVIKKYGGKEKAPKMLPALMFFDNVGGILEDIQAIQHDETNQNDCAKDPHDLTHSIDGLRYFAISRQMVSEKIKKAKIRDPFFDEEEPQEEGSYLTGAEPSEQYMNF